MTARIIAPGLTVAAARRAMASAFRAAGLDTPELDARLIAEHALGLDRTAITAADGRLISDAEASSLNGYAARRLAHEPIARIRGRKEFWSLDLRVTPDVLVPRPETETLVEAALAAIGKDRRNEALKIADLGTGSGALLLALLYELPHATGVATDRSLAALAVARINAHALGLASRAAFVACDYGTALRGGSDLIVTNPPYIPAGDIATLAPEVRDFDPRAALDGGTDGLNAYRALAADAARLLRPHGLMIVECGYRQAEAIAMLFVNAGLSVPRPAVADLSGIPRALVVICDDSHSLRHKKALGKCLGSD
ncbi:MAG: peptide chain release factor N(5)-glutamine methyltransferase [Xanthobacteraceae bacterium]